MKPAVFAAMAVSLAIPGLSQAAPAKGSLDAKTAAGSWNMSGEGNDGCTLKLNTAKTGGGWDIDVPAGCVKAYPRLKDASAWTIYSDGPAIGILNSARQRIYRFERTRSGEFVTAPNRDGDQFTLAKGPPPKALTPKERMSGGWSLSAEGGASPCAFTATSNTAGTEGKLTIKSGCSRPFRGLPYASWAQKRNKLDLLDSRGKVLLTFKRNDPVTWQGQSKAGKPIYYSRD